MTKTTLYLLLISSGLLLFYFGAIIYTWFFRYFSELRIKKQKQHLEKLVHSVLNLADKEGKVNAIQKLKSFVKDSATRKNLLINILIDYGDEYIEGNQDLLMNVYEITGIKPFLIKRLSAKSFFIKSLACRQLGALKIKNSEAYILKLISCENNDVRYNVLLALARLGDINGLIFIFINKSEDINISYRAVIEIISAFTGSKEDLFKRTLELSDDYIRGILIKAAADYKIEGLKEYYLKFLESNDKNLRIACIRALCEFGDWANEDDVINMLTDKDWEVRAAAAKSLQQIGTNNCFTALGKAIGDSEWWVRHNAAKTLIFLPGGKEYASKIINGNDKYAREAVVNVMEMIN